MKISPRDRSVVEQRRSIKAMRNIIAHEYGSADWDMVWETVMKRIPPLKEYCLNILRGWPE